MSKPAALILALIVFIVAAFGFWYLFLRNENKEEETREGPIIFFGDSLTAGVGAGEGEDFPSTITKELNLNNVNKFNYNRIIDDYIKLV